MIKVAIVEDSESASDKLLEYIAAFSKKSEGEFEFETTVYRDAVSFLTNYKSVYDLVFMDIELPLLDGMTAAEKLRKMDTKIMIIFVTNMSQFAVRGYEVGAFDYILKPVVYNNFELKMKKAASLIRSESDAIVINKPGAVLRVLARDVRYIEVSGHKIVYHLEGESVSGGSESLSGLEARLAPLGYVRCNKCYLVNCRHIQCVQGSIVTLFGGEELLISRPRKKSFMLGLAQWLGKGN